MAVDVATAYVFNFVDESQLGEIEKTLEDLAQSLDVRGIMILAHEGYNTTLSGKKENVLNLLTHITQIFGQEELPFIKWSQNDKHPFRRFTTKVRQEIVTTTRPDLNPQNLQMDYRSHLSPKEWHETLVNEKDDIFLVDTRNWYETQIGTFKGAVDPKIDEFTEFPEFIEKQNLPKDKKILMFCTGGIRCEKGILDFKAKGYENVYQLEGGILNYLKEFPNQEFDGECFVFDHRVSVDQNLEPSSQYGLCPHCGQPGDVQIECSRCDGEAIICKDCRAKESESLHETCSKNCAYHWEQRPGIKGPRQKLNY